MGASVASRERTTASLLLYELFLGGMAFLIVAFNFVEWLIPDDLKGHWGRCDGMLRASIMYADNFVCILFFIDFLTRHVAPLLRRRAPQAKVPKRTGWGQCLAFSRRLLAVAMDLASCLPSTVGAGGNLWRTLRAARRFRLFQAVRMLRATEVLGLLLREARSSSVAYLVSFFSFMGWLLGAVAVLAFESEAPAPSIKTAGDALWWSAATMTTVGYGDVIPVTAGGRVVAVLLMLGGVSVFGAMSGLIASFVLGQGQSKGEESAASVKAQEARPPALEQPGLQGEVRALRKEVAELRRLLVASGAFADPGATLSTTRSCGSSPGPPGEESVHGDNRA